MKASEKLLLVVGVIVALFGLLIVLGAIVEIFDPKSKNSVPGDIALLVFLGVLPVALGVWLVRRTWLGASRRAIETREQIALHVAGQHGGTLTVLQLAEGSGMTIEQAKDVLDRLYRKSFSDIALAESGEMVYKVHV